MLDCHQLQQGPAETVREDPLDDRRIFSLAPAFGIEKIIKCIRFLETKKNSKFFTVQGLNQILQGCSAVFSNSIDGLSRFTF